MAAAPPKNNIKLGPNEELLPDGRILIRGTLRADGSRRPDRIKKAGFLNEEDRLRNKYVSKGARIRNDREQEMAKSTVNGQYIAGMTGLMRDLYISERNGLNSNCNSNNNSNNNNANSQKQEKERLRHHIESLVAHIIDTNKNMHCNSLVATNNNNSNSNNNVNQGKKISKNFCKDVILPLLSIYNNNESKLRSDIANHYLHNNKDKQLLKLKENIENNQLRQQIIRYMSQLLVNKQTKQNENENNNSNTNTNTNTKKQESFGNNNHCKHENKNNNNSNNGNNESKIENIQSENENNSKKKRRRRKKTNNNEMQNEDSKPQIRGRGTFTYGTGKMISGAFEQNEKTKNRKSKKQNDNNNNNNTNNNGKEIMLDIESMNSTKRRKKKKQLNDRLKQINEIKSKQENGSSLQQNEIDLLNRAHSIISQLKQFDDFQQTQELNE